MSRPVDLYALEKSIESNIDFTLSGTDYVKVMAVIDELRAARSLIAVIPKAPNRINWLTISELREWREKREAYDVEAAWEP